MYTYQSVAAWQNGTASDPTVDLVFYCDHCNIHVEEQEIEERGHKQLCNDCARAIDLSEVLE